MPRVMEALETLRPEIEDSCDRWRKMTSQRDAESSLSLASSSPYARHAANDPALSWSYKSPASILDASDYQDLAVDLARKEMHRRKRSAGVWDTEGLRRKGAEHWDDQRKSNDRAKESKYMDDEELRRQMEATRRHLDRSDDYERDYEDNADPVRPVAYSYPSINKSAPLSYDRPPPGKRVEGPRPQPPRPPKERYLDRAPLIPPLRPENELRLERPSAIRPPPRPEKGSPLLPSPLPGYNLPPSPTPAEYSPVSEELPKPPPKLLAEPAKQKRVTFRPAAYLENNEPIRPVFLPSALRQQFLQIASDNTRKGLEMCGMLCGTTVNNALFISHLVIPQQKCTSDTCETENESVMLDFCIENDLIVIGWIHTHPTQTCFMSSRDLHTQAGYQVMMPESIAIVCSPRHEPSYVPSPPTPLPSHPPRLITANLTSFQMGHLPPDEPAGAPAHPLVPAHRDVPPARRRQPVRRGRAPAGSRLRVEDPRVRGVRPQGGAVALPGRGGDAGVADGGDR